MTTENNTIQVELNRNRFVLSVENNQACEGFAKADINVGEKLPKDFIALMLMNPHRFKISWKD